MTVLEINSLTLVEPKVPIEDPGAPAGRIWNDGVLQYALHSPDVISVDWGRTLQDSAVVLLFIGMGTYEASVLLLQAGSFGF